MATATKSRPKIAFVPFEDRVVIMPSDEAEKRLDVKVVAAEKIDASVTGDLKGWASLDLDPYEDGSSVWLQWELEPTQTPMRMLVRAARPLIMRTKDWAIDHALKSFRRNVERG